MNRRNYFSAALVVLCLGLAACNKTGKNVAFYLVGSEINTDHLETVSPDSVLLDDAPLFTAADLVSISRDKGLITLNQNAFDRFRQVEETRGSNTAFVVCVKHHPQYIGLIRKRIVSDLRRIDRGATGSLAAGTASPSEDRGVEIYPNRYHPNDLPKLDDTVSAIFDLLEHPPKD